MRIAWTGEAGAPGAGGVKGIAHLMLVRLAERGHEIEVFGSIETRRLLGELPPNIRVLSAPVRWQWERWYNGGELRLFLSSSVMRIQLQRRLSRAFRARHAERPFDVVFQMSQLESFFGKRSAGDPPLVVHPCTIARVEWEWHRAERDLAPETGAAKHWFVSLLLRVRAALQVPHARRPDLLVGPSHIFLADLQRVFGLPSDRLSVLRHPVDLDALTPDTHSGDRPPKHRLLFVSRMSSRKGVELVVALSHRLDGLADRVAIELVGGATLWSDYSALLAGLNPRVATYHGELPHPEVQRLLRTSAALLVPSRFEPGSIVTGEALASGLPVVLSTAVGPSDVIHGSAGRVFADGDIDAFETMTRDLLEEVETDPAGVRAAARAAAEQYFDADTVVDELERILRVATGLDRTDRTGAVADSARNTKGGDPRPGLTAPKSVRVLARRVAPGLMADRDRRHERRHRERAGTTRLAAAVAGDRRVMDGPFAGMLLAPSLADVDAAPAKLLGSYEQEISEVFLNAIEGGTRTFVDVGCADGYYAVGMAYAAPHLTSHAFDIAGSARELCRETAILNHLEDRVLIRGRCSADALARLDLDGALVLIDIEGAEETFLDDDVAKLLERSHVVIEVHEDEAPGSGERLIARLAPTHASREIAQAPRAPSGHPRLASLPRCDAFLALSEHRGPRLYWLVLTPTGGGGSAL